MFDYLYNRKQNLKYERTVSLSAMVATNVSESHIAQDIILVLAAKDTKLSGVNNSCYNYPYVVQTNVRTYPSFIVQQKDNLLEDGYLNQYDGHTNGWYACNRRQWCNNEYLNSIPYTLKNIFKRVNVTATKAQSGSVNTNLNTQDFAFLPSLKEVLNYSNVWTGEGNALSQWDYYITTSNRIKNKGINGSSSRWWLRTPDSSSGFVLLSTSGTVVDFYAKASSLRSISPALCI